MKTKILSIFSIALMLSLATFVFVSADSTSTSREGDGRATSTFKQGDSRSSSTLRGDNRSATGTRESQNRATSTDREKNATNTEDQNNGTSTEKNDQGKIMSAAHRSVVATFVKSLLSVADREGGIGAKVREVARAQNDQASTTADAIAKVQDRNGFRTFLFGSDFKNLNVLKADLASTTEQIAALQALVASTTNAADQATLNTQIKLLQAEQTNIQAFINSNESKFSLFGWLVSKFYR